MLHSFSPLKQPTGFKLFIFLDPLLIERPNIIRNHLEHGARFGVPLNTQGILFKFGPFPGSVRTSEKSCKEHISDHLTLHSKKLASKM